MGLLAGTLSGMFGIGGGVFIVPALVALLPFSQHEAQAVSVGVLLIPVVLPAFLLYYKREKTNLRLKSIFAITVGTIIGSLPGSHLAVYLSGPQLKKSFGIILILVALRLIYRKKVSPQPNADK